MSLKVKTRFFLIVLILLSLFLIVFLIYPLFREIKQASSGVINQKQNRRLLELKTANLEKFKINFPELGSDLNKTETLFIKADLPVEFIRFLEKTSRDANLETEISFSSGQFQTALQGSFPDFLRFLEKLQNNQYLIEIGNLNISRQEKGDIKANLSFNVLSK